MSDTVLPLIDALEKKAFANVIVPAAVEVLHGMVAGSAQVISNEICFRVDGKMLNIDETVDALLKKHGALFAPVAAAGPDPDTVKLDAIKERALAGNVTAHGALYKELGPDGYDAWKKENAAVAGKAAATKANGSGGGEPNPWSADGWNLTAQGKVVRALGEAKASAMARAAGVTLGATRPATK